MHHYAVNKPYWADATLNVQQKDGPMATEKAADTNLAGRGRLQRLQATSGFAVEYDFP
jgi:hypothetical protein